ncbi:MAG: antitoxin [Desulfobacula sp.]|nr:antitoxin [Desulfobacula sp.]
MNTKLTLRLDEKLIKSAKNHATISGKSVSQMVADYFYLLDIKSLKKPAQLTPIVKSLKGSLKDTDLDESDYKRYLENKYL